MTTIYLSSTYEDLKDYRSAVFQALRQAGYDVKAMEDYVATDKRPVDKCLADVAQADIYVGVFAFRYGYVPPREHGNPDALSITELEFRHAERLNKPCLIFAVSEDASWPRKFDDSRTDKDNKGERINRLREYLLTEKTTSFFSSPHELASRVQAAVTKQVEESKRSKTPTTKQSEPSPPREDRNRRELLAEVKKEVTGRLAQSLHGSLIKLLKETNPQQVRRPWDVEVKVSTQRNVLLAPETEMIEVFDEEAIAGKLLILGAPGAGKTTTLLQLAGKLVDRGETDTLEPMPVLLNLSSWKDDRQTIASWMVAEMHVKYGVRKDISQHWLEERLLLPLLDGLDELEPERQEKCVQAINHFQQDYRPHHLVVCCRLAEYQSCETKLQLHGAVDLKSLTENQVHHYLRGAECLELWNEIQAAPQLLELARSPLLLTIMTLVYEKGPIQPQHRVDATQDGRKYLFDVYIERMLSRVWKDPLYSKDKTLRWLAWFAGRLHSHAQTEFLIESLQPSWLESLAQRLTYRMCVFGFVVVFVLVTLWLKDWVMAFLPEGQLIIAVKEWLANINEINEPAVRSWVGWSTTSLAIDFVVAVIAGLAIALRPTIKPIETLRWSRAKAWAGTALGFRRASILGIKYGTYIGLIAGLITFAIWTLDEAKFNTARSSGIEFGKWDRSGQIAGVILGLLAWVTILWMARSSLRPINELSDWPKVISDWPIIILVEVLISGLVFGVAVGAQRGLLVGTLSALGIGLITAISRNHSNRPILRVADGVIAGLIGWLIYGVLTWFIGGQLLKGFTIGLSHWMNLWLLAWLGIGAASGLAAELIAKLSATAKTGGTPQRANIGVWQLLALTSHRWLLGGAGAALVATLSIGLVMGLGAGRTVESLALFSKSLGIALNMMLGGPVGFALIAAVFFVLTVALPAALIGALTTGLSGPDIERRTMPNQGIRQAAVNAGRFAVIGGLVLGSIWGLQVLVIAVLATGLAPDTWDCFSMWLASVLLWAPLASLVPGAACIQHFTLRLILWCRGVIPWQYARFLDYATERMFLQRVGGRYRFIHDLLRDHFAAIPSQ